jgi:hypothetical protein
VTEGVADVELEGEGDAVTEGVAVTDEDGVVVGDDDGVIVGDGDVLGDGDGVRVGVVDTAVQTSPARVDTRVFRLEKELTWLYRSARVATVVICVVLTPEPTPTLMMVTPEFLRLVAAV